MCLKFKCTKLAKIDRNKVQFWIRYPPNLFKFFCLSCSKITVGQCYLSTLFINMCSLKTFSILYIFSDFFKIFWNFFNDLKHFSNLKKFLTFSIFFNFLLALFHTSIAKIQNVYASHSGCLHTHSKKKMSLLSVKIMKADFVMLLLLSSFCFICKFPAAAVYF